MRVNVFKVILSASLLLTAPLVTAVDSGSPPAGGACREEIRKICGAVEPGNGRIRQCIEQNRNAFSPACQQQMAEHAQRAQQKAEACRTDVEQYCKGIEAGGGRILRCLKENEAKLSPACREGLSRHKGRPSDRREPLP